MYFVNLNVILHYRFIRINVNENRKGNQEWTPPQNRWWTQVMAKGKQFPPLTLYRTPIIVLLIKSRRVGHHYAQTNTKNINKTNY